MNLSYRPTAIEYACDKGYVKIVKILIENGVDINFQNKHGSTLLMAACYDGNQETVEYLIEKNTANINIKNTLYFTNEGYTALDIALNRKHFHLIPILRKHGAKYTSEMNDENTELELFAEDLEQADSLTMV